MSSRAIALTAFVALNFFFFLLVAMLLVRSMLRTGIMQ